MIELRQFRQFVAVAEELSFRRAAARLNMAQPPLTATIKRIEIEVGTKLLERTNRITRLTHAGQVFLTEARRTILQADHALRATRRAALTLSGTLRITFVASAAREILPSILLEFRRIYPQVKLELREAMSAQQVEALLGGKGDVGFVIPPLEDSGDIRTEVISRNRLVAAIPENHPLSKNERVSLAAMAKEPWVSFSPRQGPGLHRIIRAACTEAGFTLDIAQEAPQMDTIVNLVAGGMGVALVSRSLASTGRPGVVFRELKGLGTPVKYELAVAYREDDPLIAAFVSTASAVAQVFPT